MSDKSIFDMERLLESTCDDKELAAQVAGVFLADIPVQLAALQGALDKNDAATAERVAHSIKGASATVGGEALRLAAFECEALGKRGELEAVRSRLDTLREHYALLERELRANGFAEE